MTPKVSTLSVMNEKTSKFSIDDLSVHLGINKRKIRYYIQKGLVDRPKGVTGKGAHYTHKHLEQLLSILKWKKAGLSLERIEEILKEEEKVLTGRKSLPPLNTAKEGTVEVWSRLFVSDGVEIHIEPSKAGLSSEQVREFFREMMHSFETIKNNGD